MLFAIDEKLYAGRPLSTAGRTSLELACYDFLDALGVFFHRVDHDPAFHLETCRAVERVLGAPIAKNLFLCNRQRSQFYLLLLPGEKVFKTKYLSAQLGCSRLSFAPAEDLERLLGVQPGSASLLALLRDRVGAVQLVLDRPLLCQRDFGMHPCQNTSTLRISTEDLTQKVIPALGHLPVWVDLPEDPA